MSLPFTILDDLLNGDGDRLFWSSIGNSPDGRYVISYGPYVFAKNFWILDRQTDTVTPYFDADDFNPFNGAAIDDDGSVYFTPFTDPSSVYHWTDLNATAPVVPLFAVPSSSATHPGSLRLFVMPDDSKKLVWLLIDNHDQPTELVYIYDIADDAATAVTFPTATQGAVQDSYGDVWVFGRLDEDDVYFKRVVDGGAGTAAPDTATVALPADDTTSEIQVLHTSAGWFVCANRGKDLYLLDDTDFSVIAHRSYASVGSNLTEWGYGGNLAIFRLTAPGLDDFWFPGPNSFDDGYFLSDLCRISAADLATLETRSVTDWEVGDEPAKMLFSSYEPNALISLWYGEDLPVIRYFPGGGSDGGSGDGLGIYDDDLRVRVWGYSLDGHDKIVFRLGPSDTLVYDRTTQQWAEWQSPGRDNWRAHIGQNWIGMSADTFDRGFGSDVVAGDDDSGVLWVLDPEAGQDDHLITGIPTDFDRIVTGGIPLSGREVVKCNAVTLGISLGDPTHSGATITLRTSDDNGQSWVDRGSRTIAAGTYDAVVEWRSLGLMRAPGRLFEFSDDGANVSFKWADMR